MEYLKFSNLQKNTWPGVFLNKVAGWLCATLFKETQA